MTNLPGQLTGRYFVRVIRPAFHDARHWLPSMRDRAELRRQALKLRFWGQDGAIDTDGLVVDLNWSWIKALRSFDIGELRIDDVIGGHNNLRVITWHPKQDIPASWSKSSVRFHTSGFYLSCKRNATISLKRTCSTLDQDVRPRWSGSTSTVIRSRIEYSHPLTQ